MSRVSSVCCPGLDCVPACPRAAPDMDLDMAALARERQERAAQAQTARTSGQSLPWGQRVEAPDVITLKRAHRSIQLAHSVGLLCCMLAIASAVLFGPGVVGSVLALLGVGVARAGGSLIHGSLPPLLVRATLEPTRRDHLMPA